MYKPKWFTSLGADPRVTWCLFHNSFPKTNQSNISRIKQFHKLFVSVFGGRKVIKKESFSIGFPGQRNGNRLDQMGLFNVYKFLLHKCGIYDGMMRIRARPQKVLLILWAHPHINFNKRSKQAQLCAIASVQSRRRRRHMADMKLVSDINSCIYIGLCVSQRETEGQRQTVTYMFVCVCLWAKRRTPSCVSVNRM